MLADVEQIQAVALDRLALNAAETSAQRGKIALTRLRYLEARSTSRLPRLGCRAGMRASVWST